MVFGMGIGELLLILFVIILIFGPGRIGRLGKSLRKGVNSFSDAVSDDSEDESDDAESSSD